MSSIKYRKFTSNMAAVNPALPQSKQIYQGPGVLMAVALDRTDSSGLVTTIYDSSRGSASDPSIYAQTGDTDLGQSVATPLIGDADLVAGTATAGVGPGLIFANGLYVVNSGDTTDVAITWEFWFKPLIKKSVRLHAAATSSNVGIFSGPCLWHGYSIRLDGADVDIATCDFTFTDESDPSESGPTVMTKTDYATGGPTLRKVTSLTGEDEAGSAVSTAATGAYANQGIYLGSGLSVAVAQAANPHLIDIEALFEV